MDTFSFRGLPIAFVRSGAGSPVVFLHNGGTSHAIWRHQLGHLAIHHQVFALDLLGYGASAKPGQGYALDTYVELLSTFIDRYDIEPAALVGNCMGSAISLAFATRRPRAVRKLVLINPLTESTFRAGSLGTLRWLDERTPHLMHLFSARVGKLRLPDWAISPVIQLQLGAHGRKDSIHRDRALHQCYANAPDSRSLVGLLHDLGSYAALDALPDPASLPPICTIWGEQNRVLSAKAGRKFNELLRPARAEWLPDCGHLPMLERPEKVNAILEEFLAKPATDALVNAS